MTLDHIASEVTEAEKFSSASHHPGRKLGRYFGCGSRQVRLRWRDGIPFSNTLK